MLTRGSGLEGYARRIEWLWELGRGKIGPYSMQKGLLLHKLPHSSTRVTSRPHLPIGWRVAP